MSDLISRSKEEWKAIQGYEGIYEVSNFGNVRSLPRYKRGNFDSKVFKDGDFSAPTLVCMLPNWIKRIILKLKRIKRYDE